MSLETNEDICNQLSQEDSATVLFNTDFDTVDNTETMDVFIEIFDIDGDRIKFSDGTYCEIEFDGALCEVHASGNGDFSSHKIEIKKIG